MVTSPLSLSPSGQMRYTKSPTEVWPSQPENFREVALEYYDLMLRITKGLPSPIQTETHDSRLIADRLMRP